MLCALTTAACQGGGSVAPDASPVDDVVTVEDLVDVTVDDAAVEPPLDAAVAPVDARCVYERVTPDRNGEPRNAAGQIRWCWPGEALCACDADNDCYRQTGYAPRCDPGGAPVVDAGTVRDTGVVRDAAAPVDAGPLSGCAGPVPAATAGPELRFETIHFDWSMQCYRPEDGSLFVFVEDTQRDMVALRFYDFLNHGGPATGDTLDLSAFRAPARPFFVSTLSGIVTEPTWRYERAYLAYEGQVVFQELRRSSPVGTRMRVEFRNVRAREVRQYTDGRCENVADGARMFIGSLVLDLPVNNLHTDQDCIDWAGG